MITYKAVAYSEFLGRYSMERPTDVHGTRECSREDEEEKYPWIVVNQIWEYNVQLPGTNSIRAQETADMAESMSKHGVTKDDLAAKIPARVNNTVRKTQRMWTLDDLDSCAVVQLL